MTLNAVLMSRVLMGLIALLIILAGVGYYYASLFLRQTVVETSHIKTDAALSEQNIAKLKRLETELATKQDVVARTEQLIAESGQYRYQDQIVRDINAYASRAGVTVIGYDFGAANDKAAAARQPKAKNAPTIKGIKTINATLTLATPIKYDNFLRFLKAIEQNLTKMQITGVNMSPDNKDPNAISNPAVGVQIYVKE